MTPDALPLSAAPRRKRWPNGRWWLVCAVGLSCVFCASAASQRRPHLSVAAGGGAAQAYHNTFNCQNRLNHHEAQRMMGGGVDVDVETESGVLIGGGAAVHQFEVQRVSSSPTPIAPGTKGETSYTSTALAARGGFSFGWGSIEVGGTVFLDLKAGWPLVRVRGGALNNGLSGVVQLGTDNAQWGAPTLSAGGRLRIDRLSLQALAGNLSRPMREHSNANGVFVPGRTVRGSIGRNGDAALMIQADIAIDEAIAFRLDGAVAEAWSASAWIVWTSLPQYAAAPETHANPPAPEFVPAEPAPTPPTATAAPPG
ncbi:MAG: hypothetical protein FJ100_06050 [Deltaproteobacteria bacterium]|nr:hypothetical protein [Deltaproteobacteria bacterium]